MACGPFFRLHHREAMQKPAGDSAALRCANRGKPKELPRVAFLGNKISGAAPTPTSFLPSASSLFQIVQASKHLSDNEPIAFPKSEGNHQQAFANANCLTGVNSAVLGSILLVLVRDASSSRMA